MLVKAGRMNVCSHVDPVFGIPICMVTFLDIMFVAGCVNFQKQQTAILPELIKIEDNEFSRTSRLASLIKIIV